MWTLLLFVWCSVHVARSQDRNDSRLVQIAQGPVLGYRQPEFDVFAFYGIPYATVTERYKAPGAPPTWNQTYEAVDREVICPQPLNTVINNHEKNMQEDCLIVNIFVPNTEERNLPVLIRVHGGAFQIGYGTEVNYRTLAKNKNIIVISFNYRVGILGFLCLGTKEAPGNAGLKDQLALLRWVKQNIASFGGNPNDVTLSGCSAGSAAVDILTLSDTTKGLFNKAMSDSGGSLGSIAVQVNPIQNAKDAAKMLDFHDVDDFASLQEFYKNASIELLTSRSFASNRHSGNYFSPCVERDLGEEAILLDAPYNILKRGEYTRYPTIYGFTDLEGLQRMRNFNTWKTEMNEKFSDFFPGDLHFETEQQKEEAARTVKQFYFGDEPVSEATVLSYVDYFTDVVFAHPMMRAVKAHAEAGNFTFYLYEYKFYDQNSPFVPFTNVSGAPHCAQSQAAADEDETNFTAEYRNMKAIMRELWGNFIITGVPSVESSSVPSWPATDGNRTPHLSLGRTVELKGTPIEDRARLWDDIYERYYRAPTPPTGSASTITSFCLIYMLVLQYLLI